MILIDAAGLKASRPNRPLFDDVSLTLSDGDRTLILESPPLALRGVTRRQRLTWTRVNETS